MPEQQPSFSPFDLFGPKGFSSSVVPIIDQTQEQYDGVVSPWLGYQCAQLFTPGISGILRRIELNLEVKDIATTAVITLFTVRGGIPSHHPEDLIGRSEVLKLVRDGWNAFQFNSSVSLSAGRTYAISLYTSSLCDWRVRSCLRPIPDGGLCQRWRDEGWEESFPVVCATFRTYMEPFRSASSPSCL